VITTPPVSNTFDVRLIVNPDGDEEGKVLGIYSHGVPDFDGWLKIYSESQSEEFMKDFGIVKSYAGNMLPDSAWKKPDVVMPMVIHVFKDYNSKAKFDTIFDPTFGMFKGIAEAGRRPPPVLRTAARIPPGQGRRRVDHEAPRPGRLRRISSHCYTTSIGTVIDLRAASNKEGSPPRRPR
jgi:hypothetical protein